MRSATPGSPSFRISPLRRTNAEELVGGLPGMTTWSAKPSPSPPVARTEYPWTVEYWPDEPVRHRIKLTYEGVRATEEHVADVAPYAIETGGFGWSTSPLGITSSEASVDFATGPPSRAVLSRHRVELRSAGEPRRRRRVDASAASGRARPRAPDPRPPTRGRDRATDVVDLVTQLHTAGKKRETIRKSVKYLAAVLDFANIEPNPARDRNVRLPHEETDELEPPSAEHVEGVYRTIPTVHRVPLLWLDWSGARVGSVDTTKVGEYDEQRRRVRLRRSATKSRRALWVDLPDVLADAIEATLPPREDRDPEARLFPESGSDALRTSIAKACRALGIPLWSPHNLRHRRVSLLHSQGALVGRDRGVCRAAKAVDHGRPLHARPR